MWPGPPPVEAVAAAAPDFRTCHSLFMLWLCVDPGEDILPRHHKIHSEDRDLDPNILLVYVTWIFVTGFNRGLCHHFATIYVPPPGTCIAGRHVLSEPLRYVSPRRTTTTATTTTHPQYIHRSPNTITTTTTTMYRQSPTHDHHGRKCSRSEQQPAKPARSPTSDHKNAMRRQGRCVFLLLCCGGGCGCCCCLCCCWILGGGFFVPEKKGNVPW